MEGQLILYNIIEYDSTIDRSIKVAEYIRNNFKTRNQLANLIKEKKLDLSQFK